MKERREDIVRGADGARNLVAIPRMCVVGTVRPCNRGGLSGELCRALSQEPLGARVITYRHYDRWCVAHEMECITWRPESWGLAIHEVSCWQARQGIFMVSYNSGVRGGCACNKLVSGRYNQLLGSVAQTKRSARSMEFL
jgi:hypothetical protein